MSLESIMNIAASGMSAQTIRLNVTASNLANANTISGTEQDAYHAKQPVFSTIFDGEKAGGVSVTQIRESTQPVVPRYEPSNSLADQKGNIYLPNVNTVDEMANMMAASSEYKTNVEVMNTSKNLMIKTLGLLDN